MSAGRGNQRSQACSFTGPIMMGLQGGGVCLNERASGLCILGIG
ncbi:hypothetical protein RIEGSTA812A_PEG_15 [invertebrate metagenome]|uniref:Uncharacterized protein n=1 Tax=invertebrate metagenome TaxID=1711999 RepID=A0A484H9R2_9ZZZZ